MGTQAHALVVALGERQQRPPPSSQRRGSIGNSNGILRALPRRTELGNDTDPHIDAIVWIIKYHERTQIYKNIQILQ